MKSERKNVMVTALFKHQHIMFEFILIKENAELLDQWK